MDRLTQLSRQAIVHEKIARKAGGVCDFYVDGKRLVFDAEILHIAALKILEVAYGRGVTHIGGEESSSLPLIGAILTLSQFKGKPLCGFMIRRKLKDYGKSSWIEGSVTQGDKVIVVDDITGTGFTGQRCCQLLIQAGIQVQAYMSIVDRNEGAAEKLKELGIELQSLVQIVEIDKGI
ncbi:Orotate phosphoribosyltransferase [compost metagenome]